MDFYTGKNILSEFIHFLQYLKVENGIKSYISPSQRNHKSKGWVQIICHQVQNWSGTQGILLTDLFSCNFAPLVEWLKSKPTNVFTHCQVTYFCCHASTHHASTYGGTQLSTPRHFTRPQNLPSTSPHPLTIPYHWQPKTFHSTA